MVSRRSIAHIYVAEQARIVGIADDAECSLVGHVQLAMHGDVAHEPSILHTDKFRCIRCRDHAKCVTQPPSQPICHEVIVSSHVLQPELALMSALRGSPA